MNKLFHKVLKSKLDKLKKPCEPILPRFKIGVSEFTNFQEKIK